MRWIMSKTFRLMIIAAVLFIGGIIFLVIGIKDKAEFNKPRMRLEEMRASDLYEGQYVEGNIYEVWDEFAYTEESKSTLGIEHDKKVTDRYFMMPMEFSFSEDEPTFIALCTRNSSEIGTFRKMVDEAIDYYNNDAQLVTKAHFVGKVQALKGDYLKFFRESVSACYGVSKSEADRYSAPFLIRSWQFDNSGVMIGLGIGGIVIGLAGLVFFILRKIKTGRF